MALTEFIKKMMIARQFTFEEGRFEILGIRGVNLPVFTVTKLIERMYEREGEAVFDMLFEVGREHGAYGIDKLGKEHNVKKRQFPDQFIGSGNIMGLGKLAVERFNWEKKKAILTIEDSPFKEEFENSDVLSDVDRPIDDLMRGILHEMTSALFDMPVESEERKCTYLGDETCEIVITGKDENA